MAYPKTWPIIAEFRIIIAYISYLAASKTIIDILKNSGFLQQTRKVVRIPRRRSCQTITAFSTWPLSENYGIVSNPEWNNCAYKVGFRSIMKETTERSQKMGWSAVIGNSLNPMVSSVEPQGRGFWVFAATIQILKWLYYRYVNPALGQRKLDVDLHRLIWLKFI